jgi:hypothetical protein
VSHVLQIKLMDIRSCYRVAVIINLLTLLVKIQYNKIVASKECGLEVHVHKIEHTCISTSRYQNLVQITT